jgi:hypothetical protein
MIALLTAFFLWNAEASWSWWVVWVMFSTWSLLKEWKELGQ